MNNELLKLLFPISLFLVGVIHLIPSRILIQSDYIENLYGIKTNDLSIKMIVLHRAFFFLFIGILYNRYHSRLVYYFNGLVHMMPIYSLFFLVFTMANIALPGSSSFVGEFLLLCGIYKTSPLTGFFGALGVILCGAYSLWLYNRIVFGNLKTIYVKKFKDINLREFFILFPLFFFVIFMGIYPSFFSNFIHLSVLSLSFFN